MTDERWHSEAHGSAAAGVSAVHVQIRDDQEAETIDGAFVAAAIEAIRAGADVPVGVAIPARALGVPIGSFGPVAGWPESSVVACSR